MAGDYNLGTASGRIVIDGSGAERGFAVARAAADTFFKKVQEEQQALEDFGKKMLKRAAVGATGFTIASKAAMGFEKRLSAIQAVSGATESEMKLISKAALEIGAATSFSAAEAAIAFEELIKAGISTQEALDGAAQATVDLAAAGEISLPRAAEIAAAAMNNFNKAGKDMPAIADTIAGAANASAISVEEFSTSMNQVGAVAELTGLSFDDMAVAIAEMGNAGIKGSDAGTSLKTMLMNLIPVTDRQVNRMKELGLMSYDSAGALQVLSEKGIKPLSGSMDHVRQAVSDYLEQTEGIPNDTKEMGKAVDEWLMKNGAMQNAFFDTEGKVKDLASIQDLLQDSLKGLTKEQQLATLEVLFGQDAIRAAAVMADNGAEGYNELATAMGKVSASDVANTRLDNLAGDIEELRGAIETFSIRVGTWLLPAIREVVQAITKVVQFFANASDAATELMADWLFFKTVGMGVLGVVILLVGKFGALLAVVAALKVAFDMKESAGDAFRILKNGGGVMKALSVLMTNTIRGSIAFRAAFKAIEFLFLRILGLGGIIAVFKGIGPAIKSGASAGKVAGGVFGGLAGALGVVGKRFASAGKLLTNFGGLLSFLGGPIGLAIRILLGLITAGRLLYGTWEPFRNLVDTIAAAISDTFNTAMAFATDMMKNFVAGFKGLNVGATGTAGVFYAIGEATLKLVMWLRELWDGIVANVVPAFNMFMDTIGGAFMSAMERLGAVIVNDLWPALQELGRVIVEQVWPALVQIWEVIGPVIGVILIAAGAIVGGLLFALIKVVEFILGTVLPILLQFAGPVLGFLIQVIVQVAVFIVKYLITPLIQFVSAILGFVIPAVANLVTFIRDFLVMGFEIVMAVVQGVIDFFIWLGEAAVNVGNALVTAFNAVVGFFTFIGGLIMSIGAFLFSIVSTIVQAIMGFLAPVFAFIGAVFETWFAIFSAIWNLIFTVISGVLGFIFAIVVEIFNDISAWLMPHLTTLMNFFQTLWNNIVGIWNTAMAFLRVVIHVGFTFIRNIVMTIFNAVWGFLEPWVNRLTAFFQVAWALISSVWNTALRRVQGFVNVVFNAVRNFIEGIWNGVVDFFTGIWDRIVGLFSGGTSDAQSESDSGFMSAVDSAIEIFSGLLEGLQNAWNAVVEWFGGIRDTVVGFFSDAGSWLSGIGRTIIDGLIGGLTGAAEDVKTFFTNLTASIPDWKGPEKVDKQLLVKPGEMIIQGLVDTFNRGAEDVRRALTGITSSIPLAINTGVNANVDVLRTVNAMPISPTMILPEPKDPNDIETERPITINIEGVDSNNAQAVADTIMSELKRVKRGGKYAGV